MIKLVENKTKKTHKNISEECFKLNSGIDLSQVSTKQYKEQLCTTTHRSKF